MSSRLLPPNRSSLERSLRDVLPAELPVPLRELNDPARCEAALLPYLAWTRSVDRWDPDWSDEAKRNAVATSFVLHQRKGTLTALRQVVEPIGALSEVTEWWQRSPLGVPGTFEITVDVSDRGIDEGTVLELERLLDDVRPVSRHLTRLDLRITPVIRSRHGLAVTDGDTLEIFPGNSDMTTNTPKYGGLLTDIGAAALAAASAAGKKWQPTHMLIGDAGGAPGDTPDPLPSAAQKSLINQRHRAQLNRLFVSDKNANTLVAEVVLPVEVGGFWIREIGLQDADGKFVAVSNCPPSYKAAMESGSARTQTIRVNIALSGLENVQLLIDNGIIYATQDWVKEKVAADFKGRKILAGNGLLGGAIFCRPQHWPGAFRRDGGQLSFGHGERQRGGHPGQQSDHPGRLCDRRCLYQGRYRRKTGAESEQGHHPGRLWHHRCAAESMATPCHPAGWPHRAAWQPVAMPPGR